MARSNNFQVIHLSQKIAVEDLGANSVALVAIGGASSKQNYRIGRMRGWITGDNLSADVGPMIFGISQDSLTISEIDECLSAQPGSSFDTPQTEEANRLVYPLAGIVRSGSDGKAIAHFDTKDSPFKGFTIHEDEQHQFFVWNADQDSAQGAGTRSVNFFSSSYGVWFN